VLTAAAPQVSLGSRPPDFCSCTLKVPRSAVGSGSGRPEPARPMSQLGRTEPIDRGLTNDGNRRLAAIPQNQRGRLRCAETGHSLHSEISETRGSPSTRRAPGASVPKLAAARVAASTNRSG
jgi:hypothetical protein